ncbi:MAG TPA: transcriptional regulator, partial [Novosphingobium sp.]|nr:transcriptional regulator [Novosphingobium sp.]
MQENDPRTNLLRLATERGVSLSALSSLIGRNSSYLQQFVRKGSPRKLEEADRATLASFLGVSESLLSGYGEGGGVVPIEIKEKSYTRGSNLPPPRASAVWVDVPRLDIDASAGPGAQPGAEAAFGVLRFSAGWLR